MRRLLLAVATLLAVVGALGLPLTVSAHALAQSSEPADGATLQQAPKQVVITFGETPDPRLSAITVVDTSGTSYNAGPAVGVPGNPLQLEIPLRQLPDGVYTVTWRTVSAVDGHLATGAFAFGVGKPPGAATAAAHASVQSPPPTVLAIVSRWLLFIGLLLILGLASTCLIALRETPGLATRLIVAGWIIALIGTVGLVEAEREATTLTWAALFGSSLAGTVVLRVIAITMVGLAALASLLRRGRWRRAGLGVGGLAAAAAAWIDVSASHAGAQAPVVINLVLQWIHILAAGVWVGGLGVLLLAVRGQPSEVKGRAVRRYSTLAGVCLLAIAVTGVIRAVIEIRAWGQLFSTAFGILVIVKVGLITVLAGLGAINRYRNVAAASRTLRGLRRIGSTEVIIAAAAVLVAAALVNVAPPVSAASAPQQPQSQQQIAASGSDYATTVKAQLEISPGTAGFNQFVLHVNDYDTGRAIVADKVLLQFTIPSRPDIGGSSLTLPRQGDGSYQARGGNLSIDGAWQVDVIIELGAQSVEVHLQLTTITVPPIIDVSKSPGLPTLYTIHLPRDRQLQVYLDPDKPGADAFHTTFFDAKGADGSRPELPLTAISVAITPPGGEPTLLTPLRLSAGHFTYNLTTVAGSSRFDITATTTTDETIGTHIDLTPGH